MIGVFQIRKHCVFDFERQLSINKHQKKARQTRACSLPWWSRRETEGQTIEDNSGQTGQKQEETA